MLKVNWQGTLRQSLQDDLERRKRSEHACYVKYPDHPHACEVLDLLHAKERDELKQDSGSMIPVPTTQNKWSTPYCLPICKSIQQQFTCEEHSQNSIDYFE